MLLSNLEINLLRLTSRDTTSVISSAKPFHQCHFRHTEALSLPLEPDDTSITSLLTYFAPYRKSEVVSVVEMNLCRNVLSHKHKTHLRLFHFTLSLSLDDSC
ncbi:hypothetical protein Tcan_00876, partial [Toxocara canis]